MKTITLLLSFLFTATLCLAQPAPASPPSSRYLKYAPVAPLPTTLDTARKVVQQLRDEISITQNENHALTLFLKNAVDEKNGALVEILNLRTNIEKLNEWGLAEQKSHWEQFDRAESEHKARVISDDKYHKLKWPLVLAAGIAVFLLTFNFVGPISGAMGPYGAYALAVPFILGIGASIALTFLI